MLSNTSLFVAVCNRRIIACNLGVGCAASPEEEQRHHHQHELHDESDKQDHTDGIQCLQKHGGCGEMLLSTSLNGLLKGITPFYWLRPSAICQCSACSFAAPYAGFRLDNDNLDWQFCRLCS